MKNKAAFYVNAFSLLVFLGYALVGLIVVLWMHNPAWAGMAALLIVFAGLVTVSAFPLGSRN